MEKSKTYCVMTHVGMAIQNNADYSCCNLNKESWKDNNQEVIRVYSHPLKTAFKSHTRELISTALDNGIRHPSCQACWDHEDTTGSSSRIRFNQTFKHLEAIKTQPRVLVIKPGNTCNFACRMCNPGTSSSWYGDGYELEKADLGSSSWYSEDQTGQAAALTFNEYTRTFETIRNSFGRNNEEFWPTLKEWIGNFERIVIYGGEPFLTPAMFDVLEHGVATDAAKNISLNLHTNASLLNERYTEILTHYKSVGFNVSIDSMIPEQFNYIRYKGNFELIVANTKRFLELFQPHKNIDIKISLTITPINVFYLDEILQDLEDTFNITVIQNIAITPEYNIRHLPLPVKQMLITKLKSTKITSFLKKTIPGCDVEWPKFCRATDKLDQLRGESFAETFPEWWKILEPHWVK
jgi:MoaA/NifB/PqqE/SkfB family radical SAM enzyme